MKDHILIVGGTGMLRFTSNYFLEKPDTFVSVIARNSTDLGCNLIKLDYQNYQLLREELRKC
jgi:hypothetical protein